MCPSLAVDEGLLSPALRKYPGREEEEEEEEKKKRGAYIYTCTLSQAFTQQSGE